MSEWINFNGTLLKKSSFSIGIDNRAFKYGDGFFETMLVHNLTIQLEHFHFERLFRSLALLEYTVPEMYSAGYFRQQLNDLLQKNDHTKMARLRLMIFRGGTGLLHIDNTPNFVAESFALDHNPTAYNLDGWSIDVYPHARKAMDQFANIKSNSYQPYLMAGMYAAKHRLNDVLILNSGNRIAKRNHHQCICGKRRGSTDTAIKRRMY